MWVTCHTYNASILRQNAFIEKTGKCRHEPSFTLYRVIMIWVVLLLLVLQLSWHGQERMLKLLNDLSHSFFVCNVCVVPQSLYTRLSADVVQLSH